MDLRRLENDYLGLGSELETLEDNYRLLLEDKGKQEAEQATREQKDAELVLELEEEAALLTEEIDRNGYELDQTFRNTQALKRLAEAKHKEADILRRELALQEAQLKSSRQQSGSSFSALKHTREEKHRAEDTIMELKQAIEKVLARRRAAEREFKKKEAENMRLDRKLADLENQRQTQ